jgi:hypothetical protein
VALDVLQKPPPLAQVPALLNDDALKSAKPGGNIDERVVNTLFDNLLKRFGETEAGVAQKQKFAEFLSGYQRGATLASNVIFQVVLLESYGVGHEQGYQEGYNKGYTDGIAAYEKGFDKGLKTGILLGAAAAVGVIYGGPAVLAIFA